MVVRMTLRYDELLFKRHCESWLGISPDELLEFIEPKCQEMLTRNELVSRLKEGRPLRVKFGIDPTGSQVHMGHLVPMLLLNQFGKAGHRVDFIVGGFTARIGDPSWRDSARVPLTLEEIDANMRSYRGQVEKFVDVSRFTFHNNADWIDPLTPRELFEYLQCVSLSEATQRDDFRNRMKQSQGVSLAEVCYGILMGVDSVHLKSDIELGGVDQLLNFQQCRSLMRQRGQKEEVVLMTPILEGTAGDGRKMSKSFGNYIALSEEPKDKFGKVMSIPDSLLMQYYKAFADVRSSELDSLKAFCAQSPFEAKKQLASLVVALGDGLEAGLKEREEFERFFSKKVIDTEASVPLKIGGAGSVFEALAASGEFASKSELRRLFEQKGVKRIEGADELALSLADTPIVGQIVKVGKRKVFKLVSE
jgi:tyrosyl-tRNA synthetase